MKIAILHNLAGTSVSDDIAGADDDTADSAAAAAAALKAEGNLVEIVAIRQSDIADLEKKLAGYDVVVNLVEWTGRNLFEGVAVIEALERAKIKYTGCTSEGYLISGDKAVMKQRLVEAQISTPKYQVWSEDGERDWTFPVIVKPTMEHCGIGIDQTSVVENDQDLNAKVKAVREKFDQPVLIEEYIAGPEAHVTVVEKDGRPWVLTPAVFKYKEKPGYWGIMSYESKWNDQSWEAGMTEWDETVESDLSDRLKQVGQATFSKLSGRGMSRVDMRIRNGQIYVLEINHNPGIGWDEDSGLVYSCRKEGISYNQLLSLLVHSAL